MITKDVAEAALTYAFQEKVKDIFSNVIGDISGQSPAPDERDWKMATARVERGLRMAGELRERLLARF